MKEILEIIISVPGAVIFVSLLAFIAFMTKTDFFKNLKFLYKGKDKEVKVETESKTEPAQKEGASEQSEPKGEQKEAIIEREKELEEDIKDEKKECYTKAMQAYFKKDIKEFTDYWEKLIEKVDEAEKSRFTVSKFYHRYNLGDSDALKELEKLEKEENEHSKIAREYLTDIYESLDSIDKAIELVKKNIEASKDSREKLNFNLALCDFEIKRKEFDEADGLLKTLLKEYKEPLDLSKINKKFGKLFKAIGNLDFAFYYNEKALEENPADDSLRFNTAYTYSNNDQEELALYHYKILDSHNYSSKIVKNNMGVAYHNLEMPIKGTKSYLKAKDEGETLASSNIGYKLIDSGFIDFAKKELDEALRKENVHKNVNEALASIDKRKENEKQTEKKFTELANAKREFSLKIHDSITKETKIRKENIVGEWKSTIGKIEVSQEEKVVGEFSYNYSKYSIKEIELNYSFLKFSWKEKDAFVPKTGIGYFLFSEDCTRFEGILLDFRAKNEFMTVSGNKE